MTKGQSYVGFLHITILLYVCYVIREHIYSQPLQLCCIVLIFIGLVHYFMKFKDGGFRFLLSCAE